ncbi:hypothetical protein AgCh_037375 [Apium graveolens]
MENASGGELFERICRTGRCIEDESLFFFRYMPKYMSRQEVGRQTATMDMMKSKEGLVGLSYPMLTKSNYTAWSLKMRVYMQAHGIWEAIEPTKEKPTVEEKTDKMALAAIYQGIPEEILLSVADKTSAKEAWEAVNTMCLGADKVEDFAMKLNGIVTNIRALGEKVEEAYVVKKLLRAVPSKFLQITSTIEQFGDLETMSIEEAVGSLRAHEERLRGKIESGGGSNEGQLLLTEEEWKKRSSTEGQLLFTREEWLKRSGKGEGSSGPKTQGGGNNLSRERRQDRSTIKCYNCNILGHYASECNRPRRVKNRDQRTEVNLTHVQDDEPTLLMLELSREKHTKLLLNEGNVKPNVDMNKREDSNLWYLDNGASNHMTGFRSKFKTLDENMTGQVRFGDGSTVEIKGKGSVGFKCKNGEELILNEVYYIPYLCDNIISLGQLSKNNNEVILRDMYLWVYDKHKRLIMKVKRTNNRLYKIFLETVDPVCLLTKEEESSLWHSRFGHVNYKSMKLMSTGKMALGLPDISQPTGVCEGCLMSKQTRMQFPQQTEYQAKKPLELIHGDLCGPISPETTAGNRYFFLLVDDYTRMMWIYALKGKNEAFNVFKKFRSLVEKESGKEIKVFRTDRGGEFMSKNFINYCEDTGINRHFTAPYSPQQNGVVERRNRTVVAMARNMLKTMSMPSEFWGEATRHAVYLLNRLPTRALTKKTPYEVWKNRKPNVSHVKVFGCVAHMKVPSVYTSKLSDRSKLVIYLGREPGTKAYRLFDPNSKTLHVSRDVVFEENKSWAWDQRQQDDSVPVNAITKSFVVLGQHLNDEGESEPSTPSLVSTPSSVGANSAFETSSNTATSSQPETGYSSSTSSDASSEPKGYRSLRDIYDETEVVEIENELLLVSIDEPSNFKEAVEEQVWKKAMEEEIKAIE